jgi:cytochrome P450
MALTYISYQLAKTPSLIQEIAKELSQYNTLDDLNLMELEKLPLLNAVIHECMRMYPPVPLSVGRICPPQGTTVGGYFIPARV